MQSFYKIVNLIVAASSPVYNPDFSYIRNFFHHVFLLLARVYETVVERCYGNSKYPHDTYPALFMDPKVDDCAQDASFFSLRSPGSYIAHKIRETRGVKLKNATREDIALDEWPALLQANGLGVIDHDPQPGRQYVVLFPNEDVGGILAWWDGKTVQEDRLVCTYYSWRGTYRVALPTPDYEPAIWIAI